MRTPLVAPVAAPPPCGVCGGAAADGRQLLGGRRRLLLCRRCLRVIARAPFATPRTTKGRRR